MACAHSIPSRRRQRLLRRGPLRRGPLRRGRRRGAVLLELILTLPVWLILIMAVVEFGMILVNQQQVALASRVGAEKASETAGLSTNSGDPLPDPVLYAVQHQLGSTCLDYCSVILEHNVVPPPPPPITTPVVLQSPASPTCDCDPPTTALPTYGRYVRVTVCVPLTKLAPNLLSFVGFDISGCVIHHSTTFRHEL